MRILFTIIGLYIGFYAVGQPSSVNLGYEAGNSGYANISIGYMAGHKVTGGNNSFLGAFAGFNVIPGSNNAFLGYNSGYNNITGTYNTYLGTYSGYNSTGSRNIFIGFQAGYNELGSDKLYIDNSNTASPLIYGDFSTDIVAINGKLGVGTINPEAKLHIDSDPGVEAFRVDYHLNSIDFYTRASFKQNGYWAYALYNSDEGGEPRFTFRRARGTSFETPSAVQAEDKLGAIFWEASNDNEGYTKSASIEVFATGSQTDGVSPARIDVATTPTGSSQLTTRMTIQHDGMVGIGTVNPERLLEIYSESSVAPIRMTSNRPGGADSYLEFKNKTSAHPNSIVGLGLWGSMDGAFIVRVGDGDAAPEEKFRVNADGHVGIGTMFPGEYKLAVNGHIKAKEVNVSLEGWSDFVFEENYELPALSEVEEHIKENKHLPGIPSAREVEQNGVNLGQMDALLLQKIEELTLYMIEQEKELKALKEKNNKLEEEVNKLMTAR